MAVSFPSLCVTLTKIRPDIFPVVSLDTAQLLKHCTSWTQHYCWNIVPSGHSTIVETLYLLDTALLLKHCTFWTQHYCWNIVPSGHAVKDERLGNWTVKQRDKNSRTIFVPREEFESVILMCAAANTSGCWLQKYYINLHAHTRRVLQLFKIQSPSKGNNYSNQTFKSRTATRR